MAGRLARPLLRSFLSQPSSSSRSSARSLTQYPIDDRVNGLTEEQVALRETVSSFCLKELAPHAAAIDKENDFPGQREFWRKAGTYQ